jgi:hypothetical protein
VKFFLDQFDMSTTFSKFKTQPNNHVVYSSFVDCIFTDIDKLGAKKTIVVRRVWGYQRGNQNPYFKEGQKTQWPNEKGQKNKQQSTKHTHQTKDRVTRTPQKSGVSSDAPERVAVPAPLVTPVVLI